MGCSLAMVVAVLEVEAASLSHGVRPCLPACLEDSWGPPSNTVSRHLYITSGPNHKTVPGVIWRRSRINDHMTIPTLQWSTGLAPFLKYQQKKKKNKVPEQGP